MADIVAQHEAMAADAKARAERAVRTSDAAKNALARAEAEREAAELKQRADVLAERLEKTIDAMQALPRLVNNVNNRPWGPAASLMAKLSTARFYASV